MDTKEEEPSTTSKVCNGCYALPWCSIFLVTAAIVAHTFVLKGNLATADTFANIGRSTEGWSDVGMSLSSSMIMEIEEAMTTTVGVLTAALNLTVQLESQIDSVLGGAGNSTQKAVAAFQESRTVHHDLVVLPLQVKTLSNTTNASSYGKSVPTVATAVATGGAVESLTDNSGLPTIGEIRAEVKLEVTAAVVELQDGLKEFFKLIKPALLQVGKWLHSMGSKIQGFIEQFSQTIDKVQKIFDQVMSKIAHSAQPGLHQKMLYNTFNIFDISHTGNVTPSDMQEVSNLYGITALNGKKGDAMIKKYDDNGDGQLDADEYSRFVDDPDLPQVMSYVLRIFSKRLSEIAGVLAGARKRDEVAHSLGEYLTLMCAKNLTKVSWVSERLTNASLPMELSIDVFKELTEIENAPDKKINMSIGLVITKQMMLVNQPYVARILEHMADPELWNSQGWEPMEQPKAVHQVTQWVADASEEIASESKDAKLFANIFLQEDSTIDVNSTQEEIFEQLRNVAGKVTEKRMEAFQRQRMQAKIQRHEEVFHAAATTHVYRHLLGQATMVASGGTGDEDIDKALHSGLPAAPETLRFAKFLVNNATGTSQRFQGYSFDYAKTSSNQIDSFANGIQAMVKKVQNFLNLMMDYSTPRGIKDLETKIEDFALNALGDIEKVVDNIIKKTLDEFEKDSSAALLLQRGAVIEQTKDLSGVWKTIKSLLKNIKSILPTVVDDLKFAKKEVSGVSSTLHSIFSMLKEKGGPVFDKVSGLYKTVWMAYYSVFLTLSLLLLFYAFWATGWIGGPSGKAEDHVIYQGTCWERITRCCNNCLECMKGCQDWHLCLWSCIIISEFVILIMFIVSIVFCLLAGIKAFINLGCGQIYILGDDSTCTSILNGLRAWLETFWTEMDSDLADACDARTLTACKVIAGEMMKSIMYTVVGSFVAAIFSLQLIFETARKHEQAVYNNKLKPATTYWGTDESSS